MKKIQSITAFIFLIALLFSLGGCAKVPLLQGGDFSPEYRAFLKSMCKHPPVSVAFEQYSKKEGFDEEKLIVDTDPATIKALVNALAAVRIKEQVKSASNFAVRHYTFTDKKGTAFTFEFYGSYLKAEGKFYLTENTEALIAVRLNEKKSGTFLAALDEAYDGMGDYSGKRFISCRLLEEKDGALTVISREDFELSPNADIAAPLTRGATAPEAMDAQTFFTDYEQRKGQENANYIFTLDVQTGVILSLRYEKELSASEQLL